jgi:hypothetical protein
VHAQVRSTRHLDPPSPLRPPRALSLPSTRRMPLRQRSDACSSALVGVALAHRPSSMPRRECR